MIERKALTSRVVKSAKTTGLTTEIWDTRTPNFGLKVTKRGHKRWIVKVRNNGLFRRVIIGECPEMSLKEARGLVPKVQEEEGNDKANWAVKKVTARAARRRVMLALRKPWTFEEAVQDYMRFKTPNLKRGDYVDRRIELELIPLWGKKALSEITPYDVLDLTDTFLEAGLPAAANNRLELVRRIFDWLIKRGIYGIDRAPSDRMSLPAAKTLRTRVLLESELRAIWEFAGEYGYPFGQHVQLLMMLGVRSSELARSQWKEFKLKESVWTIPETRSKSGVAHHVRLPRQALSMFRDLPQFGRKSDHYVFTSMEGRRPIVYICYFKKKLDESRGLREWRYHDLRRTVRTNLSRLKVPGVVADTMLGHSRREMHRVYDQYGYERERAEALQLWANELERIVNPHPLFGSQ